MADFYDRVLKAGLLRGTARAGAARAQLNEAEHVKALTTLLTDAGQSVPLPEDFAFTWPGKTFESTGAAATAGAGIEAAVLGAYLTAATAVSIPSYRMLFARALAAEAQHLAVLSWVADGKPVGNSFPEALDPRGGDEPTGALPWLDGSSRRSSSPPCSPRRPAPSATRPG